MQGRTFGKAAVIGAGAWGTALAFVLAETGHRVALWARREELAQAIQTTRCNKAYLPEALLPSSVVATSDAERALDGAELVVFVAPSHATREVARALAPHIPNDTAIVSATKGIENDTLMFMDDVLREALGEPSKDRLAFLSGPSFAGELVQRLPTAVVVASRTPHVTRDVMERFHTKYLRLYASDDVIGVECGGALKNVIAIAAGALDGLGLGHNSRAGVITRGLSEIAKISLARGGSALTLAGLAGMGDLVLTCTGSLSRNRTVGVELGKGRRLGEILAGLGHVAEGVRTAKSACNLSTQLGLDLPIINEVYSVLYEDKSVRRAVDDLMARELRAEFDHT